MAVRNARQLCGLCSRIYGDLMKKTNINLIPDSQNPTPDYYCTWQTQLYATSDGKPKGQRAIIGEKALFDTEKPFGWAYFYEKARNDLIFVMDDSWDVSMGDDPNEYGSLILNREKFPVSTDGAKTNAEALKRLTDRIKSLGWKGLGGWVCAQEAPNDADAPELYWKKRLTEANEAGFSYWKVDWGKKGMSLTFRKMLTDMGKRYAPDLVIEHAMRTEIIPEAAVFRTYDVPALMSIPMTMEKLNALKNTSGALINCEDEAYIAAAGGFSMGIMRHQYSGAFPDGKADMSFPSVHRDLKTKLYEVIRAARFHRIAPAFSAPFVTDAKRLYDTWRFVREEEEIEAWWLGNPLIKNDIKNGILTKSAPTSLAKKCPFPLVLPDENGDIPYTVVSKNPNGVFSVATLGRTRDREYFIPRCEISLDIENADTVGVFGSYQRLVLHTEHRKISKVLMQDLADDLAYDITDDISFSDGVLTVSGCLIEKIGTSAQPKSDTSEAGVLIKIF